MATRKQFDLRFVPRGVCDTVDGDNVAPGAMAALKDLIFDPSTPGCFICRPANTTLIDFSAWGAAPGAIGVITAAYQVSDIIYGLVGITSGAFSGKDYPFAYNVATGAFLVVSGIIAAKCPASQATTGAWTPPQMTLTGIDLVVTHIGFDGTTHFFGWFDVTTPTSPAWDAANTTTHGLPSVPQAAQQFNNRTYFFCGSVAYYTDTLTLAMTNANQSLTVGDFTPVTCAAPLPVGTTSQGILQGVLAFKANQIYLITGDAVLSNLGLNLLSPSVGTTAPRSVVPTPLGVSFMATDGIRNVNFFGVVSPPDKDLAIPFIYAVTPSRVAAAFNSDIYRICVQNGGLPGAPYQDYWFNIHFGGWTGPHSFRYDVAVPVRNDFAVASNAVLGKVWNSYVVAARNGVGNTYVENGTQMQWAYVTSLMTDLGNIYANSAQRVTVELAVPSSGQIYSFNAENENNTILASGIISFPANQALWGHFNWGQANWGASQLGLVPYNIPWNQIVVFNKLTIAGVGNSALGLKIGGLHLGYKRLKYLLY